MSVHEICPMTMHCTHCGLRVEVLADLGEWPPPTSTARVASRKKPTWRAFFRWTLLLRYYAAVLRFWRWALGGLP